MFFFSHFACDALFATALSFFLSLDLDLDIDTTIKKRASTRPRYAISFSRFFDLDRRASTTPKKNCAFAFFPRIQNLDLGIKRLCRNSIFAFLFSKRNLDLDSNQKTGLDELRFALPFFLEQTSTRFLTTSSTTTTNGRKNAGQNCAFLFSHNLDLNLKRQNKKKSRNATTTTDTTTTTTTSAPNQSPAPRSEAPSTAPSPTCPHTSSR